MIAEVAVPYHVPRSFHYTIDQALDGKLEVGSLVEVNFKNRTTHGYVLGLLEKTSVDLNKLKPVGKLLISDPLFDEKTLRFLTWLSQYYCHPLGEVISAAIPKQVWLPRGKNKEISLESGTSEGLLVENVLRPVLNDEQSAAVSEILSPDLRPVLLHGITGSGKTEVYMQALDAVLEKGKGAIILVPEIALTPQLLGRFSARFPGKVAVLHSDLTPKERFIQWERLRLGLSQIVIGPRSAVFAPIKDLGLIVVDEEHETSFKQEDSVHYHARDGAIVRAKFDGAKIVLGSATPSLESYANASSGKYSYVQLKNRARRQPLPKTTFVDLKESNALYSSKIPWLSKYLLDRVRETLKANQQVLLYLNRLGFAHFLYCNDCGHSWRCHNCDVALTYYKSPPSLRCHYCGLIKECPSTCENCSGLSLRAVGTGTQQVETALKEILPDARIARMDRSAVKNRDDLHNLLTQITRREVDIVIGTQMVTKGHDFAGIALVGILLADASLNIPDFRANERTFQIITQVSGRAGRLNENGEVIVQTLNPDHPVLISAAQNKTEDFYRSELNTRQQFGFPPYCRMAILRFQHSNRARIESFTVELCDELKKYSVGKRCQVLGPAEAPLSRLKNQYRWHCLLKSDSVRLLQELIALAENYVATRKVSVQMAVDVDPVSLL